jgi:hypothetical protein
MSSNNFEGFFENPDHPEIAKNEPPPQKIVEALAVMCSQVPNWYTKPVMRMMAHGVCSKIAGIVQDALDEGTRPEIHPAWAAFLMLIQERLITSYEQYADDAEREAYPLDHDENDPPQD